ncbi:hypothetical protein FD815_30530 [Klebsiella pneumoniae]|nr:hypothetical protein [Klebsiella pneumoniae]
MAAPVRPAGPGCLTFTEFPLPGPFPTRGRGETEPSLRAQAQRRTTGDTDMANSWRISALAARHRALGSTL